MHTYDATIAIVTKDRKDELRRCLGSCVEQSGRIEILVIDDGSKDDTSAFVTQTYPQVRLITHRDACGLVLRRNEAVSTASAPVVYHIDDDAWFAHPNIVAQSLSAFTDPDVGAIAINFVNLHEGGKEYFRYVPERPNVGCFVGTAHAVRRDVFLGLGGYRAEIVRQGEEIDFCLRLFLIGKTVQVPRTTGQIMHHHSAMRSSSQIRRYALRNRAVYAYRYGPRWWGVLFLGYQLMRHLAAYGNANNVRDFFSGANSALRDIWSKDFERVPVPITRLWRFYTLVRSSR